MLDAREGIIIKTLERLPREDVVLIGGYAVNAYVPPRFSIDCDLVVLGSSSKLESLLREDGFKKVGEGDVSYGTYVRYETEKVKVSFDLLKNSVVDRDTKIVFEGDLFQKYSAERTTVGRSVPTRIRMRIVDPELLFAMKFVSARRQDVRDMFMLSGADLNWDLVSELVSVKCGRELIGKRSRSISRDVQSENFRDSLHGPFGRIPSERFELCRRRLVEFLKTASTRGA
ncbi:MAG TPA: nucleotidyl transferase AbiEii/AbiGii toxin family protein [Candidatus Bathyarchaeia archaeon]|nr:nucleotidyl transferase AbiEii/AbiGii toxin family protein [Candidatus Bathyarchaeia archaeon]